MKKQCGFTLDEKMVACALAFILFGIAITAASSGLEAARSAEAISKLLYSLMQAASRASFTGTKAVPCPSKDGEACDDILIGATAGSCSWIKIVIVSARPTRGW